LPEGYEKVDAGEYLYRLNGQLADVTETWARYRNEAGNYLVESERRAPGMLLKVAAHIEKNELNRFLVQWSADDAPELQASYLLSSDSLTVEMSEVGLGTNSIRSELQHNTRYQLFPLMRIFSGAVISQLLSRDSGMVVVPDIRDPANRQNLLQPLISDRSAKVLHAETISVEGVEYSTRCCEYVGGQYTEGGRFWLSESDLLVRYTWQQSDELFWDVSVVI
jgi:hypothetical protein